MQGLLSKRETGESGESMACRYLRDNGYTVIERNFKTPTGEIDIIAKKRGTLHFFEVKARHGAGFGTPFEALTPVKIRRIKRTAEWFLAKNKCFSMPCLFGVIGIDLSHEPAKIECMVDAFE